MITTSNVAEAIYGTGGSMIFVAALTLMSVGLWLAGAGALLFGIILFIEADKARKHVPFERAAK